MSSPSVPEMSYPLLAGKSAHAPGYPSRGSHSVQKALANTLIIPSHGEGNGGSRHTLWHLVSVSVRLKSTSNSRSRSAREIIHRAEKQLLQDSQCISGILHDTGVKVDIWRSRLSSLVKSSKMVRCIEFMNKVRELRFIKVRHRQVNKFHILVRKGNRGNSAQPLGNNVQLQTPINNNKWVINLSDTPNPSRRVLTI